MTATSIEPTVVATTRGVFRERWELLFGRKVAAVHISDHTRVLAFLGRLLSPLLLVAFSLASLIVLAGEPLAATLGAIAGQGSLDYATVVSLATTALLIIAMDVVMLLASIRIRDAIEAGKSWKSWLGLAAIVTAIGAVEALTFSVMLIQQEHHKTPIAWALILARASIAPGCAIFLAVLPSRELTRQDVDRHLLAKTAALMLDTLERMSLAGDAAFSEVLHLFLHLTRPANQSLAEAQAQRDAELAALLEKMSPQAIHREADRLLETERSAMHQQVEEAQRAAQSAMDTMALRLRDVLIAVTTGRDWPTWVGDIAPDIAAIDPASLGHRSGNRPANRPKAPASRKDMLLAILEELDVNPAAKPNPNSKDTWIKSSDIPKLSDGSFTANEATILAKSLGNSNMDGRAYIAPMRRIAAALAARKALHPSLIPWHMQQVSDADTGEHPAVMTAA